MSVCVSICRKRGRGEKLCFLLKVRRLWDGPVCLILYMTYLVCTFWQEINMSVVVTQNTGLWEPLNRHGAAHFFPIRVSFDYRRRRKPLSITFQNAGFCPPSKRLNKMELVNCVYGNKFPFHQFFWHSNAFLNIIKRSFSTWIHLLQAALYFCKSKFQQVWFHSFYSILFALTKLKIPTATWNATLIAWMGIIFYWLTV